MKKLARLGIKTITEGGFCTHLAAPHILRTEKFLCALAYAPTVVSLDWVSHCVEKESIPGTDSSNAINVSSGPVSSA
jgi:Regulator of Ty1 transposition protein 107 BRCT domain